MVKTLSVWVIVCLLSSVGTLALAAPMAVPAEVHTDIVTSMAASARVYAPSELPLTGRNCAEVLDDLRVRASFHGEIRSIYPGTGTGTCYTVRGRREQVAVVCCAPRES